MLHTPSRSSRPSHVTVKFGDGWHSFPLAAGATLTELAECIGVFGAKHDGAPISIDIAFETPPASSKAQSHPRFRITH